MVFKANETYCQKRNCISIEGLGSFWGQRWDPDATFRLSRATAKTLLPPKVLAQMNHRKWGICWKHKAESDLLCGFLFVGQWWGGGGPLSDSLLGRNADGYANQAAAKKTSPKIIRVEYSFNENRCKIAPAASCIKEETALSYLSAYTYAAYR